MIETHKLHYQRGGKVLLDDISVTIPKGKITTILGPNGAGKSTLLKCLTGAVTPDSGNVLFSGKALADFSLEELARKRAVLSQSTTVPFPFTVEEIVMMGRNPYAQSANRNAEIVRETLQKVDAWHLRDRIFPTLSGGEQQRVQIGRTLAQIWDQQDAYLFLDEPTSALDLKHQQALFSLLQELKGKPITSCCVIHDLNLATRYADHVILMQEGSVKASGDVQSVITPQMIEQVFNVSLSVTPHPTEPRLMVA